MRRLGLLVGAVVLASAAVATTSTAAQADAASVSCTRLFEGGQRAKAKGKLRNAREDFLSCAKPDCPSLVRSDCARQAAELSAAVPSIVLDVRDAAGKDLVDVVVDVDGEQLTRRLDGHALEVDPGVRVFRFTIPGFEPMDQQVVVKEGVKSRVVPIVFQSKAIVQKADASEATRAANAANAPGADQHRTRRDARGPWVLVGLGAVGVATGALFCALGATTDSDAAKTPSIVVGVSLLGLGGLLIGSGVWWYSL